MKLFSSFSLCEQGQRRAILVQQPGSFVVWPRVGKREEGSSLAATDLPGGKKWAGGKEGRRERGFKGGRPPQSAFALRDRSDEEDIPED